MGLLTMLPLAQLSAAQCKRVKALLFDIDDTLTTHGVLTLEAYRALWRAKEAGLHTIAVTGRPAGWCDHVARTWPVSGVVGENGALAMWHDGKKLQRIDVLSSADRAVNRAKLQRLQKRILKGVPGCAVASDQSYREYDLAIDFCEDVPALPASAVQSIVDYFEHAGATAKVSSIHVNGWFGTYSKVEMSHRFVRDRLKLNADACVFVGDSPNDQPMFAAFKTSVGVANVRKFSLQNPPKYVTRGEAGKGFAQLVAHMI